MEQMSSIRKDCEVEVFREDEEFIGSYKYIRAILEQEPRISGYKILKVRYLTLLNEDRSPLTETVDESFIRPIPPDDLNDGVVLEEGSVVDAYLGDGWWTGVVEETMEDDKYLVHYDCPPDIIQFEKNELRVHLDWINFKWVRLEKKELIKSVFSSGTMVELGLNGAWRPRIFIKELEDGKRFILKIHIGNSTIRTLDSVEVRPPQPSFSVEKYELLDRVEAFRRLEWRQGVVRGIVFEGRYMVSFGATKAASQFSHSDIRPPMEWVNGVWHKRSMTPEELTRKRKRGELEHNSDINETFLSSDGTSNVIKNEAANVEQTQSKDLVMVLPFAKKSPFWKTYVNGDLQKSTTKSTFQPIV